ncbi:putative minichromosome loss protein 1 protein [Zalerion maritima]|uniref:Minichromosome loss protein 1 protein n=1 Tax=Zalerion maritima TaxID=339359 RepID=A0AAD5WW71_9PEZI|nr:putative minichromosome loss protein 1 protein [Zalerion maritima]
MASTGLPRHRPRPAHTQGSTRCAYTPDGTKLVTVGSNNTIRLYRTGFDGEPTNIDECPEQNVAVAASNEFFVSGSEDGTVSLYSIATDSFEQFLLRCPLPIRDVALSPDNTWCAVASDELTVSLVSTRDITHVKTLRDHNRPTKHLSFDPKGSLLALSCTDGKVYVYSLTAEQPELIRTVDDLIPSMDADAETSSRVAWHPDGRAFAAPTSTRDVQVMSKGDWEKQRAFKDGHMGDITALAWSPNGALLATAGKDKQILIWETKTQTVASRHEYAGVMDIAWHPTKNILSFTTGEGEVYICPEFVQEQFAGLLKEPKQPAPFIHDPLKQAANNAPRLNGKVIPSRPRRDSLGSLASLLDDPMDEDDDFVVDDDGAGYAAVSGRKRPREGEDDLFGSNKRQHVLEPEYHEAFQPGSTPWRGNRKYLCLNLIGFVWTVDQDGHNTVTIEFYDNDMYRNFHFTDTFLYDKACLNEHGALFACPPRDADTPATIFYRPHETWIHRSDWRTQLPKGEAVVAMSLSESYVTVTTSSGYVRIFTLFGIPCRVYRPKSMPIVTCASWRDYVMILGNGPVGADGRTRLLYNIENVKRDEVCQNEDTVALPEGETLKSVFFSDSGDPCIYDSTGTLLTLLHWRQPSRAVWVPLLDTKLLPRLASGKKSESYYPIAVADGKFHCIILKGGDQYPYFPRPLLSEFDFAVPLTSSPPMETSGDGDDDDGEATEEQEGQKLQQAFLLGAIAAAQMSDLADATSRAGGRSKITMALARKELDIDKTLLQLLAGECRVGEERGMRALELVTLMRDRSGKMIEAAGKVADRYGRTMLGEKIREVGEKRMAGDEGEDEF